MFSKKEGENLFPVFTNF